jgi:hypothetical protein
VPVPPPPPRQGGEGGEGGGAFRSGGGGCPHTPAFPVGASYTSCRSCSMYWGASAPSKAPGRPRPRLRRMRH